MASDPIPRQDAQFQTWATNFATVAAANQIALGLTSAMVTAINNAASGFSTAYVAAVNGRVSSKGLTATKDSTRETSETTLRISAKQILANPNVTNTLKGQLGLNPNPTPIGPVTIPLDLSATAYGNGTNSLRWKRNGNVQGTAFIVEAKIGAASGFTIIYVTTQVRFDHQGQTPGVQIVYRVSAKRGSVQSSPSNEAVVYSTGGGEVIHMAA